PPEKLPKDLDWSNNGKGALVPLSAAVKKVVSIPVFCSGRLDPVMGEELLRQGKLDFVGMTRRLLADPELPHKVAEGRLEDIRPCTGCLHCMDVRNKNKPIECMVNPYLGKEREYILKPAEKKKKVMVLGAGPAGMEAAIIAAQRGHQVSLYEKGHKTGGLVPLAALVKDLQLDDLLALVRYLDVQMKKAGVTVKTGTAVNSALIEELNPDTLIIAAGPKHDGLDIPGSKRGKVLTGAGLHKQLKFYMKFLSPQTLVKLTKLWMPIGKRVVVIGGAIHGCELAEFLIKRKRQVTIVHTDVKLADGIPIEEQMRLSPWFDRKDIPRFTGVKYEEITGDGLVITTAEGERKTLAADTFIVSLPMLADGEIVKRLGGKAGETVAVGSCATAGLITDAIADGARMGFSV
ncbi:FAD-dependent oxidoreductase, partial [Chloroflexota bacterium]